MAGKRKPSEGPTRQSKRVKGEAPEAVDENRIKKVEVENTPNNTPAPQPSKANKRGRKSTKATKPKTPEKQEKKDDSTTTTTTDNEEGATDKVENVPQPDEPASSNLLALHETLPSTSQTLTKSLIKDVYSYISKQSELFWAFKEGDVVTPGSKRTRATSKFPGGADTVSQGYGETTMESITRLLTLLETVEEEEFRLNKDSTFVDVGSGFGKVVFHAKLLSQVKESTGIEYVSKRHDVAEEALNFFKTQSLLYAEGKKTHKWRTDPTLRAAFDGGGIKFLCEDATKVGPLNYTHIYMYDCIFNDSTYATLAPILEKSPFKVLVSFRRLSFLNKRGLKKIRQIGEMSLNSTGRQHFKAHIYAKVADPPKNTRTKKKK